MDKFSHPTPQLQLSEADPANHSVAMSGKLKIALFLSSTRENRLCDFVANFVKAAVQKQHEVHVFGEFVCF